MSHSSIWLFHIQSPPFFPRWRKPWTNTIGNLQHSGRRAESINTRHHYQMSNTVWNSNNLPANCRAVFVCKTDGNKRETAILSGNLGGFIDVSCIPARSLCKQQNPRASVCCSHTCKEVRNYYWGQKNCRLHSTLAHSSLESFQTFGNSKLEMLKSFKLYRKKMIACKFKNCILDTLGSKHLQSKSKQQILFYVSPNSEKKKVPAHSDHYCTWSSGGATEHDDAGLCAHYLGASSEPIIPAGEANVLFTCVWDCKAAAVRAEGQGAGKAAPPDAVRPTSQTSVGRRSVNFPGFEAVLDSDTSFPSGPH